MSRTSVKTNTRKQDNTMNDDNEVFVEKPRRDPRKFVKSKGDNWSNKAKKGYKARVKELEEDSLDEDVRHYDDER